MGRSLIRSYESGDVTRMKWRDGDGLGASMTDYILPAWTMVVDDEVVACAGLAFMSEGVYRIWAHISDDARGYGKKMIKFMREVLKTVYAKLGIHRITALVRGDRPEYARFIELMGFEYEGTMRQAAPNKTDIRVYGRLE